MKGHLYLMKHGKEIISLLLPTLAMVAGLFGEGIFNVDTEFVRDFRS
jgi:hypothetical protein